MKEKNRKIIRIILITVMVVVFLLGLILTKHINKNYNTDPVEYFNSHTKNEINNLHAEGENLIILSGSQNIFKVKKGTENFGIPIAFAPNNTQAWGITDEGCKYNVQAVNQADYCINKGWDNVEYDISTGMNIATFDIVENGIGYALIKINVPKNVHPCIQRFTIEVRCNAYPLEYTKDYFDVEVI